MAQLGINGPFLVAQIINFIILFLILRRFLFPPLLNMLDARKQRIAEGLAAADVARKEAEAEHAQLMAQIQAERSAAQQRIAEAAAQAERVKVDILAQAQREAEEIKTWALQEGEAEKQRILSEAQKQIAELALLATERVVRHGIDESLQRQLINDFLTETSLN